MWRKKGEKKISVKDLKFMCIYKYILDFVLLKFNKVATEHNKLPKIGKNSILSLFPPKKPQTKAKALWSAPVIQLMLMIHWFSAQHVPLNYSM